ncbi:MAG: hypothetical protein KDB07_05005, partial [Planctomycetes bacterium]|nr:hypothetical protein [Planctomycetota bacterium]
LPCEDFGYLRSDPRYVAALLERIGLEAKQCLMVANSLRPLATAAALNEVTTLVLLEGSAATGFEAARTPEEEPSFVVSSFDEMAEGVIDWLNAPSVIR